MSNRKSSEKPRQGAADRNAIRVSPPARAPPAPGPFPQARQRAAPGPAGEKRPPGAGRALPECFGHSGGPGITAPHGQGDGLGQREHRQGGAETRAGLFSGRNCAKREANPLRQVSPMHDIRAIRDNPAQFDADLARRSLPPRKRSAPPRPRATRPNSNGCGRWWRKRNPKWRRCKPRPGGWMPSCATG